MAEYVLGMGYWCRGKLLVGSSDEASAGEEAGEEGLLRGKATVAGIGEAKTERGREKRKTTAIGYLMGAKITFEKVEVRGGEERRTGGEKRRLYTLQHNN